jgi:hypothetical protein
MEGQTTFPHPRVEQLVVYADEKLTAFVELESAIRER